MKRLVLAAAVSALWGCLTVTEAQAQFITRPRTSPTPVTRPPVSPYLNLLRGGRFGPALGYYTLTRPQLETYGQLQQFQSDLQTLQTLQAQQLGTSLAGQAGTTPTTGLTTGHPVRFFNYGHYFNSNPVGRGLGGGAR